MSSAINHKKRIRYSEKMKGGAYRASSRKAFYRDTYKRKNWSLRSFFSRLLRRETSDQNRAIAEKTARLKARVENGEDSAG